MFQSLLIAKAVSACSAGSAPVLGVPEAQAVVQRAGGDQRLAHAGGYAGRFGRMERSEAPPRTRSRQPACCGSVSAMLKMHTPAITKENWLPLINAGCFVSEKQVAQNMYTQSVLCQWKACLAWQILAACRHTGWVKALGHAFAISAAIRLRLSNWRLVIPSSSASSAADSARLRTRSVEPRPNPDPDVSAPVPIGSRPRAVVQARLVRVLFIQRHCAVRRRNTKALRRP